MAKSKDMATFNMMDDLVEHLYQKEILYVDEAKDLYKDEAMNFKKKIEIRDIFKIDGKYYMYIISPAGVKGFAELDLDAPDEAIVQKETQDEAWEYLSGLIPSSEDDGNESAGS